MKQRTNRLLTGLRRRWAAKAVVLMYHRVADVGEDPWDLCVAPGRFEDQLGLLAREYPVVPLSELVAALRSRTLRQGTVAITFDDGYADNLEAAAPLLQRHGLPATFFITSSLVNSASGFWWDRLQDLLLDAAALPESLEILIAGSSSRWELRTAATPRPLRALTAGDRRRPWEAEPGSRLEFFYSVWKHLRQLEPEQREQALEQIEQWRGTGPAEQTAHRVLTTEEARQLAGLPGMSIGAHSATHAALSCCPLPEQRAEIERSKADLEDLVGVPVSAFAYPFGDFGPETPGLVRDAGFDCACIADPGCIWAGTDAYRLPRLAALDWTSATLRRELDVCLR